jgi:hypothetical protein
MQGELAARLAKDRWGRMFSAWAYMRIIPEIIDMDRVMPELKPYVTNLEWLVENFAQAGLETFFRIPVDVKRATELGIPLCLMNLRENSMHIISFENLQYVQDIQAKLCGAGQNGALGITSLNRAGEPSIRDGVEAEAYFDDENYQLAPVLIRSEQANDGETQEKIAKRVANNVKKPSGSKPIYTCIEDDEALDPDCENQILINHVVPRIKSAISLIEAEKQPLVDMSLLPAKENPAVVPVAV